MTHILIIGGSDAGISAALRIREMDTQAEVSVVVADTYPNFSICGLPFFLSGEVGDWHALAHRKAEEIQGRGIQLLLDHRAERVDAEAKTVRVHSPGGETKSMPYDKLLIATGAESAKPPIDGVGLPGVFFLRWMKDSFAVKRWLEKEKPQRAVVIGGGYIGLEMADALSHRGIGVTLMEFAPEVLTTLDPDLGRLIREELQHRGVRVLIGKPVEAIIRRKDDLLVQTVSGETAIADMVIVAAGAKPATLLARTAGIGIGAGGAICVDRTMASGVTDIWAAGDCVETWHRLLERNVYMPLGTTAHKQGRVAGENMLGGKREFQGSLGTQVVKVFDRVAARTGLKDSDAKPAGFDPLSVDFETWDHKYYYPGAKKMYLRITGDRNTRRLLGAQIVGVYGAEVSKRIDIVATALYHSMTVDALSDLDLSYTPPLSSPWDPVQMAAMQWCATLNL